MKKPFIEVDGIENDIDFDAAYKVKRSMGVAYRLLGWAAKRVPVMCFVNDEEGNEVEVESNEFEDVPDFDNVIAIMVGDDRRHTIDKDDLIKIDEDDFCHVCGQIGCCHDGRERE